MIKSLSLPGLNGPTPSAELLGSQPRSAGDPEEKQIIAYLRCGRVMAASPGAVFDILADKRKIIGAGHALTDDTWWWSDILAHYVETYHFKLPEEFLAHGRALNWNIPRGRKKPKSG